MKNSTARSKMGMGLCVATFALGMGCGGGSSISGTLEDEMITTQLSSELSNQSGVFIDSAVSGLYYETDTYQGITDSDGAFIAEEGAQILFKIGNTILGAGEFSEVMTPESLISEIAEDDQTVTNMLRLLQTIDEDGDPDNGIEITEEMRALFLELAAVNLDQSVEGFEYDEVLSELVKGLKCNVVDTDSARAHFMKSKIEHEDKRKGFRKLPDFLTSGNLQELFLELDVDIDDSLSEEELAVKVLAEMVANAPVKFTEMDTDVDGLVSEEEFRAATPAEARKRGVSRKDRENGRQRRDDDQDANNESAVEEAVLDINEGDDQGDIRPENDEQTVTEENELDNLAKEEDQVDRFLRIDTDDDGFFTVEDLIAAQDERAERRASHLFKKIDSDSSEGISLDELLEVEAMVKSHQESREAHFNEKDTDQDSLLSESEYLQGVPDEHLEKATERFALLDTNEDLALSLEEWLAKLSK